jgi:transcriptional regulator with XRE-family HTH domain
VNAVSNEQGGVPPAEFERPGMRAALGARDITRVFRLLQKIGYSQQRIAALTGQSQPEVSAIIHGRRVMAYDVLSRIADGLGVPRGYMGLAYLEGTGEPATKQAERTEAEGGGEEAGSMGRRAFLGQAAAITVGAAVVGPELGGSPAVAAEPAPTPARIGLSDVAQLRRSTVSLRALDHLHGGGACREAARAQLAWAERLLDSDATEEVGRQLRIAVADLRNLVGWTSLDLGQQGAAEQYFLRALTMAKEADAPDLVANILYRTARISLPSRPEESVRVFRLGQLAAQDARSPLTNAILAANQAWAFGMLGQAKEAHQALGVAEEELAAADLTRAPGWSSFFDESDLIALQGMTYLSLGEHQQRYTGLAVEKLQAAGELRVPEMARSKAFDLTALAVAHYRQGDVDHGSSVAHAALDAAGVLKSARAIDRLRPLAAEAARRSDAADARDLSERLASTVAAMSPAIARAAGSAGSDGDGGAGRSEGRTGKAGGATAGRADAAAELAAATAEITERATKPASRRRGRPPRRQAPERPGTM